MSYLCDISIILCEIFIILLLVLFVYLVSDVFYKKKLISTYGKL